ncbi:MAG: DNA repair protein RecO [Verrucomicrobia bacterium]|nr:DNA repair protein RecO [Verrucomicrobiota bacterium]
MIERATGIILRTRLLTDTSLIVHWLSREFGRVATVAKGARRPKSPFRGKLDVFYLAEFTFQRSRRSELHTLREVAVRETHPVLRQELACLQQAAYAAALLEQTTETDTPIPGMFELLCQLLAHLRSAPPQPLTVFALELKLLAELGLTPDLQATRMSAGSRQILGMLTALDWAGLRRLKLSQAQTLELDRFLRGFLEYHLERVPGTRKTAVGSVPIRS